MPWMDSTIMDLRREFVMHALKSGSNISHLCKRYGICRSTGYKWLNRYVNDGFDGFDGLSDISRKPKSHPSMTDTAMVQQIIDVRKLHPAWGGRKIKRFAENKGITDVPSASTITAILKREGYCEDSPRPSSSYIRFEHESPNELWQMDYKGHFAMASGRCHPLTIIDDHSRYSIGLRACDNEQHDTVKMHLISVFRHYGLPERINMDNGSPWGNTNRRERYTALTVWMMTLGVKISHSRPYHPQTNGKDERFHRTLNDELISRIYIRDLEHAQHSFDSWRTCYNTERPHEALDMDVPINKYSPSHRLYPENLANYEYGNEFLVRKVFKNGRIFYKGRQHTVGKAFRNYAVGILPSNKDGILDIFFQNQKVNQINLHNLNNGDLS